VEWPRLGLRDRDHIEVLRPSLRPSERRDGAPWACACALLRSTRCSPGPAGVVARGWSSGHLLEARRRPATWQLMIRRISPVPGAGSSFRMPALNLGRSGSSQAAFSADAPTYSRMIWTNTTPAHGSWEPHPSRRSVSDRSKRDQTAPSHYVTCAPHLTRTKPPSCTAVRLA